MIQGTLSRHHKLAPAQVQPTHTEPARGKASMLQSKCPQAPPAGMPHGMGSTRPTSRTCSTKYPGSQCSQPRVLVLPHGKDTIPAAHRFLQPMEPPAPAPPGHAEGNCLHWKAAGTRQERGGKRIQLHSSGKEGSQQNPSIQEALQRVGTSICLQAKCLAKGQHKPKALTVPSMPRTDIKDTSLHRFPKNH